mmetsp:Transcript_6385/g.13383  ORF Transcript_6385/g.13383 Transcript_6385/m.13383 type:complete len:438 (+) Transcript_6385:112-1425(+)
MGRHSCFVLSPASLVVTTAAVFAVISSGIRATAVAATVPFPTTAAAALASRPFGSTTRATSHTGTSTSTSADSRTGRKSTGNFEAGAAVRLALGVIPRGGSTATAAAEAARRRGYSSATDDNNEYDDNDEEDQERQQQQQEEQQAMEDGKKAREALQKWLADQQILLNLRSTLLTEALAKRGLPLATITTVSTADGDRPPEDVDWDCSMSTYDEPKSCMYSFDAEPNTKVVAPLGTTQWISLSALNRLRRTDPAKVEPMWHSRYAVLRSWFSDESEYSFLQHAGVRGFLVSNVLLDLGRGIVLRSLVLFSLFAAVVLVMPALEYASNRVLVSAPLWARWYSWHRLVHAALPFKLLVGQIAWKQLARVFAKLEGTIRDYVVDMECGILEECVPLTVGPGAEIDEEDDQQKESGIEDSGEEEAEDYSEDFFDFDSVDYE